MSQKTKTILTLMSQLSDDDLAQLYKISPAAATKEKERWRQLVTGEAVTYPAVQLFNGLMYRQIARDDLTYLQKHVLITSALYGVIEAAAPIAEHRLDFQQTIRLGENSLKTYWRESYDRAIINEPVVVSLLSSEFEEVFSPDVREQFVRVVFHEEKNGQLKTHSTISKKGRGLLLEQARKEDIQELEQLKQLTFAGFSYREALSTPQKLVFVRAAN